MAKCINKVFLLGHVGSEPELRTTAGGTTVACLSLATSDRVKDRQGSWSEKTQWHHVVAFGRTADVIREHVKKGAQLHVEGRLETRSWNDKTSDQKKYKTEVIVVELTLLGGHQDGSGGDRGDGRSVTRDQYVDQGITEDDIPY